MSTATQAFLAARVTGPAEPAALALLDEVLVKLTKNTLENVKLVLDTCRCKTAQAKHFELLMALAKSKSLKLPQSGGRIAMPSEFFGSDSGRYSVDAAAAAGVSLFPTPADVIRPAIPASFMLSGGAHAASASSIPVESLIKRSGVTGMRMKADAKAMLQHVLEANLKAILEDAKGGRTLTEARLKRTLGTSKYAFLKI